MAERKLLSSVALASVLALGLSACGGDDGGGGGGGGGGDTGGGNAEVGALKFGTLLPQTGSLAFLGPPEEAGVQLAVNDVNAAGGVNGKDVELTEGDSGDTTTEIANQTVDRLLNENVNAIIGAASSGVSLKVIDKITGAGVIMFSPANTAKSLTDYDDDGLYFRTAPSDILQGQILGEVMAEDGNQNIGILALDDPYGTGLAEDLEKSVTESGATVAKKIIYDPNATSFRTEVAQMKAANPDGIAIIGFDETAKLIQTMIEQGLGPKDKKLYGVDGNMGNALGEKFPQPGVLEGMKGTTPLTKLSTDFQDRLKEVDPKLKDFNYAGESYDAVVITSLASIAAGTNEGKAVAAKINDVTRGGEKCKTFEECANLLKDDKNADIDYDGVTGPLEFTDAGEPGQASYGILQFDAKNRINDAATEFRTAGG